MLTTALAQRLGPDRATPASLAIGAACGCAVLALIDPNGGAPYPTCPTRALLGIDCPVCGTLRGLHSLSRGHIGEALSHNILLLVAVPIGALVWLQWVSGALGRPSRPFAVPRWSLVLGIAVAAIFAVVRNLPVAGLTWLDSA